ncbi:MAG: helix-turn-helix transcriptional regulator [Hyphomicrobiales bacterium]
MRRVDEANPHNIEALVASSYEAAFDSSGDCGWCGFLAELCDYFGAAAGGLLQHDFTLKESSLRHEYSIDGWGEFAAERTWSGTMPEIAPHRTRLNGHGSNGSVILSETAAGCAQPCAVGAAVPTQLTGVISHEAARVSWICLVRPATDAAFNAGQKVAFEHLLPHFRRSLGLRSSLIRDRTSHTSLVGFMDLLPVAMLRVDRKGFVHFRNQAAVELMADESGVLLRRDGTIATSLPGATEHLRRSIAKVADRAHEQSAPVAGAHCLVPRGPGRLPLICVLYPVGSKHSETGGHQESTVAIAIKDPQATVSDGIETFQLAFGLTKAEARLIGLLLEGRGLFEAAEHLGITRNTARTHMRNIYGKVGMHRQADLIALVERFNMF